MNNGKPFRLTRFFSIASFIGIVAVTLLLTLVYERFTLQNLIAHESRYNAKLMHAFAGLVWEDHRQYVRASRSMPPRLLRGDPGVRRLREAVLPEMRELKLLKIKIYNPDGVVVFSTDETQIGDDQAANPGFLGARAGEVVGNLDYEDAYNRFEGAPRPRNVISSYVPVRAPHGGEIEGVIEIYSDVSDLVAERGRVAWQVAAIVLGALSALYAFLVVIVRKADRIIGAQQLERMEREKQIRHQAYHDPLTRLPNRLFFSERIGEEIAEARRFGGQFALMYVDLDRFKIVNDSLGHEAGDALLRTSTQRLRSCLREGELLFRMGGDEFTVIVPRFGGPEDLARMAQRIIEAMAVPAEVQGHELPVGVSLGIAVYPADGDDAEVLIRNADAAMYEAKARGRGTYAFYRTELTQQALQCMNLEAALRKAVRREEFELYYQPRFDARTRKVVALEALLRWRSPDGGIVAPAEFLPALESGRLMIAVGGWVLQDVCRQLRHWSDAGYPALRVSVNVSALQFHGASFVASVEQALKDGGVAPELIEFELTETSFVDNAQRATEIMYALKALGVSISLDDFGTGYSSLSYLRKFPVDYLKIDRSFVTNVAIDARDRAIAMAISELGRALRIGVVAEGVETEAQAAFFASAYCTEVQGFLFGMPLPPGELTPLLRGATIHASAPRP